MRSLVRVGKIETFSYLVTEEHIEKDAHFSSGALILSKPIALFGLKGTQLLENKGFIYLFQTKRTDLDFFRLGKL